MSQHLFVPALQKATTGALSFNELIATAQELSKDGHVDASRQLYQVWLALNGAHPLAFIAHFNVSTLQAQLGDAAGAEIALRSALAANPDFAPAHINLGSALERKGQANEAVAQWRTGLERMAAITGDAIEYKITLLKQISRVLGDAAQQGASEEALIQCLDIKSDQRDVLEQYAAVRLAQCKWPIGTAHPKLSRRDLVTRFHPLSACAYADDPLLQLALSSAYVDQMAPVGAVPTAFDRRDAPIAPGGRRLRVGYVSSDLRTHAVGFLITQLFEAHDPSAIEVFAYYTGIPADDPIYHRIKNAAEHWVNLRDVSDDEAAQRIGADEIDILVDVNGHTRDARLGIFARRPAPIQVNWLGYPGTMGSAFHHYIVADETTIPAEDELYFSERVLRLPCYQPNDKKRVVAETRPTRAEAGLPDDAFVLCCFNAPHKITRFSFERWMEILRRAPGSVLWLLDYNTDTNQRLREAAGAANIDPARLFFAQKLANAHHLARYPLADLVIDTSPYGAHTTASDALWMGVPVITFAGRSFAARVCASLVRAAGLPDLVLPTADAYVARAAALATSGRADLAAYRARLAENRDTCALFDIDGLARSMEGLYRQMAGECASGMRPRPNLDNLNAYLDLGARFDHDAQEIGTAPNYHGIYRAGLAARHRQRPMAADGRLWTADEIAAADAPQSAPAAKRAAA